MKTDIVDLYTDERGICLLCGGQDRHTADCPIAEIIKLRAQAQHWQQVAYNFSILLSGRILEDTE